MREIKFRAWDNKESKMIHGNNGLYMFLCSGVIGRNFGYDYNDIGSYTKQDRYILMQFTGLRDKNGKEIYEGDIVSGYGVVKIGIYEMYSDKSGFPTWIMKVKNSSCVLVCDSKYECREEVIGNIHENSSLIQ